jgi:hypothetical protein
MAAAIGVGVAVELPEGVFNVIGEWRYRGIALEWWLWELDDGAGQRRMLAKVGDSFYAPRFETTDSLPADESLEFEGTNYHLRHHGEARVERNKAGDHAFWLADFRHYSANGRILIFTEDNDETHRLAGDELDEKLVRVYEP